MSDSNPDPNKPHLYFMGICGTAMGSAAAAFRDAGYRVTGSDSSVYDPMKSFLERRGIAILDGYKAEKLPDDVDFFVIGNAQSRGNPEVEEVLSKKLPYISMPQLLREQILAGKRNFVVSGTHGKTTTSSILTWILESAGKNPGFVIGGIPGNFDQGARFTDSEFNVIEGDEYDSAFFDKRSKFIHYHPEVAILNNMEFDHADIFDDIKAIRKTFGHMVRLVPENGLVILNGDDQNCLDVFDAEGHSPGTRVGFGEACDMRITEVDYQTDSTSFTVHGERFTILMNGEYNVRNAAMAAVAATFGGVTPDRIRAALKTFIGVKRRQEIRGVTDRNITVVDDFGHHPTAIREAIAGMRHRFEGARLWAVFEPRSNTTRRNVFQQDLPAALGQADAICLSQIARADMLAPEERLDPELLMETLRSTGKPAYYEPDADAIVERLKTDARNGDVIIVFSNGGFGGIHDKLLAVL
ncbi:MAG: UDP-N-acetylmuramate:L-alanyl-gamma-D-glutamyl-meso-diaminopimelate ligase [Verrucomicrobiales bacterium]|nr:UDP-N-acetylmuramate:L-alanyl-gamma-D-glutamyl-meso-diaminopimelate ligase [Verrucomicrobiales bacterium]